MNRRNVLAGISAAALVPACDGEGSDRDGVDTDPEPLQPAPDRAPEPAPWEPTGALDEVAFAWGVASGDAGPERIRVSARTLEALVELEVVRADGDAWVPVASQTVQPVDGVAQAELVGLAPDTAYRYVFRTPDATRRSRSGRFRTALAADGFRKLVLGATSCFGSGAPDFPTLGHAAGEDLDLVLFLGDTVYADGSTSAEQYRDEWRAVTTKENLRALLASTSVVATWDDHEVANNWTLGEGSALQAHVEPSQIEAGLAAFREALPQDVGTGGLGLWRSLLWGDVLEIVALDCRGERDVGKILSDEQLAWAIDRIRSSTATFKLVLCSVHVTDHLALMSYVNEEDRWQGYPTQREALLAAAEGVTGVLFVTGDMHYGAIQKVSPAGAVGEGLWEIAAGPAGSDLFALTLIAELAGGFPEQYADVVDDWTWSRIELDPGTITATVQLVDGAGVVRAERVLELA